MSTPRWLTAIQNALAKYEKQTVIQLATIATDTVIPQARSHIVRSFLVPPNAPSLPLIVTTTDIRTPKVSQINLNPNVHIVHWIEGTQEQFRFAGRAVIVPSPNHALYQHFMYDIAKQRKNGIAVLVDSGFDWEKQRINIFKSLSGHMRATWCRPVPGSPLTGGEEEAKKWPVRLEEPGADSDEESKSNWETALTNFALLVIDPYECDYIELGVVTNRRTKFSRTEEGDWKEEALVP
ncbi:pyridoxamine 5'-phosphate oxidase-domain-containing protein [Amanita rubescens]|nr:pyridoxamine 5'-phosphate oxidase-domain-containing protein [Amanita rubescens]